MSNEDIVKGALQRTPACLPAEELFHAMEMPPESQQRRTAEEHVAMCPHCRTELALLREFEAGAVREDERAAVDWIAGRLKAGDASRPVPVSQKPPMPGWREWLWSPRGLAAGLIVAAALIISINIDWRQRVEEPREGQDVLRSAPLQAIAPAGDLTAIPDEFRWTPVEGAAQYLLVVTEVDRTEVFRGKFKSTSAPLPPSVRRVIEPGKTLQWTVTAEDMAGRTIASSGARRFRTKVLQTN